MIENYDSALIDSNYQEIANQFTMFSPSQKLILSKYFKALYENEMFRNYYIDEMINAGLNNTEHPMFKKKSVYEINDEFGAIIQEKLFYRGLKRLDYESQLYFTNHLAMLISMLPKKECSVAIFKDFESSTEYDEIEFEKLAELPDDYLENYFNFELKAITAELNAYPAIRTPSKTELEYANKAYDMKLLEKINNHPYASRIENFIDNPNSIDYEAGCEVAFITIEVLLEMEGEVQDWMMQSIFGL